LVKAPIGDAVPELPEEVVLSLPLIGDLPRLTQREVLDKTK
jgi:hypothetical protein